jgi:hypothetical protein
VAAVTWSEGDAFLARYESLDGCVRGAVPLRVIGERNGYLATWLAPGTEVAMPVLADGRGLRDCSIHERYTSGRTSRIEVWPRDPGVWLFPLHGGEHAIHVFPNLWYVNLEREHAWHARGVDTRDHTLDICCDGPSSWRWKDEDELEDAVAYGVFTREEADAVRAEGARVLRKIERWQPPFCDGWEAWQPNPSWRTPELPADWAA